jgi:hypothetical protein
MIIMVISMIFFFRILDGEISNFKEKSQNKVGRFQSTMGKQPFLLLQTQSSISLHSIEEDYREKELLKKSQI